MDTGGKTDTSRACRNRPLIHRAEKPHSHTHLFVCELPAVTCGLIAGTRGVTIQVRDLIPTPPQAWLDFSAKPTRSQSLLTTKTEGLRGDEDKTASAQWCRQFRNLNTDARTVPESRH
jgi:hypothetical protein